MNPRIKLLITTFLSNFIKKYAKCTINATIYTEYALRTHDTGKGGLWALSNRKKRGYRQPSGRYRGVILV